MAAGQGFKTFTTGEVLTATDVNGYLMQGVLVFASAAARNAAITSPQEGQFAFTKDTNGLWYYDGAAWVASGATGDIEGVTAGTGISGGGTSGTVTVTNSMATAIDAKGDLVVGTGADAFSRLAVGTNTYLLTADSAEATGLKWAAPAASSSGMTLINSGGTTFTTTGSFSINNCFSATYQNYKIIINYTAVSADAYVYLKMRASATDASTDYNSQRIYAFLTTVGTDKNANGTTNGQFLGEIQTAVPNGSVSEAFVYDPFGAVMTKFWVTNPEYDNVQAKPFLATAGGIHTTQTSYDGCTLLTSTGTISGTIYVYGLAV